ncbi:hypothetical protein [Haloarchaeobius amylolyticus]|uniref:hypothetical protein n=1 Tax=Haloarchaeobius amylolyticus TaxID=1198296 RepID=UPI00227185BC|nr:hypothetical protein [Haloarchaeobius amylolyticus]
MEIEQGSYTLEQLCQEVIDHTESAFEQYHVKHLKFYFYIADEDWNSNFPDRYETQDYGEMTKVSAEYTNRFGAEDRADFFIGPYGDESEIITILTAETQEAIDQALLPMLGRRDDISLMPIMLEDFQRMNELVLEHNDVRITEFKSKRVPDLAEAEIRPSVQRSIEYKGRDGKEAIEELRSGYGVVPVRIQYEHQNLSLKIDSRGKFTLKKINSKNFDLLFELVEEVIENVLELKDITQEIRFTEEEVESGNLSITVPKVEAGEVTFDREFTRVLAEDFVEGTRNRDRVDFSFTDVTMQAGSLDFSAQVVDENRNSFFNISATADEMRIVPETNCSFPSLIEFYFCVLQLVDGNAELDLHNSQTAS